VDRRRRANGSGSQTYKHWGKGSNCLILEV
jgi:hypothetical protein